MTRLLTIDDGHVEHLPARGVWLAQHHRFDQDSIHAVNAALASRRPLLVRGEPGIGKSQLARAVARCLKRPYLELVVDARTEARDLLWTHDAVARLADAQVAAALTPNLPVRQGTFAAKRRDTRLAVINYVRPGPLWWALNWTAARQTPGSRSEPEHADDEHPRNGCVLLIDEIDKAESEVPNGLLEALGNGRFLPLGAEQAVQAEGVPPLVIITTNEERELPPAFLRRCWVLRMVLQDTRDGLEQDLRERALAHFPALNHDDARRRVLHRAIELIADQRIAREGDVPVAGPLPRPGVAECLDLLRAVQHLHPNDPDQQHAALDDIKAFALTKTLAHAS